MSLHNQKEMEERLIFIQQTICELSKTDRAEHYIDGYITIKGEIGHVLIQINLN